MKAKYKYWFNDSWNGERREFLKLWDARKAAKKEYGVSVAIRDIAGNIVEFLLSTLPEDIRQKYITKIKKSQWHWQEQGGARTPNFIAQMKKEGVKMRITNKQSPSVKVHTHKRLIYIDEMMDDTDVEEFKKAPSWKRVCVTILKNDLTCQYMGISRTKTQMDKRKEAIKKYKEIL